MSPLACRVAPLLLAITLAGCADDRQLVVVVSSDLEVPLELASVDVRLEDEAGATLASRTFPVAGGDGVGVPFSFGVGPREAGPLQLVVAARGPSLPSGFPPVVRVIESFPPGRSGLAVHLSRGCGGSNCGGGETCLDGLCGPRVAGSEELVSLAEDTRELDLVCAAGAQRCSADGEQLRVCRALGGAPVEVACPSDTRCDEARARCVPLDDPHRRVAVEISSGEGYGRVVSRPTGIRCGLEDTACEAGFPRGSSVTLSAEPSSEGRFEGWSGDCTGTGECVLELSEHRSVGAVFAARDPDTIDLRLRVVGGGQGEIRVTVPSGQPPCSSDCLRSFPRGTEVRLAAWPLDSSNRFEGWMGACTGSGNCLPDTSQSGTVEARIVASTHDVRLEFSGGGEAQISSGSTPLCTTETAPCTVALPADRQTTLNAAAGALTQVLGFSGLCQSTSPECTFRPSGPGTVTVLLERVVPRFNPYDLNGDGVSDVVIGAPGVSAGGQLSNAGKLYFVPGPVGAGSVNAAAQLALQGASGEEVGQVFAFPGDLDGDGIADLVVGMPRANGDTGAVFVVAGRTNFGTELSLGSAATGKLDGSGIGGRFGATVIGLPDQNGDGRPEFAVGAPGSRAVRIYSLPSAGADPVLLASLNGATLDFDFGASLLHLGDVDQDGLSELAIGAPSATVNGSLFAGAVYVFRGPFSQGSRGADLAWRRVLGQLSEQRVGFRLGGGIDLLGGPEPDLAVTFGSGNVARRVAVFSNLASAGDERTIAQAAVDLGGGPLGSRNFAASLLAVANVTASGGPGLFIGDPEHEGAGKGAVHLFTFVGGTPGATTISGGDCANQGCTENRFGASLGLAGDLDGDQIPEVLVGALWGGGQAGRPGRGRVALFPSGRLRAGQFIPTFSLIGEDVDQGRCAGTGLPF